MKVADLGEFGIIERIQKNFSTSSPRIRVGIGDDAALIQVEPDKLQVLTTDMLVEGVHFSRKTAAPQQIGYKSLAVNISDVAAMAGIPVCAVVSLALPPDTPVEFVDGFYQGFARCAEENGVELVGGDTVSCPDRVIINVSLLGEVEPGVYRLRSGAQAGDLIAVTGELGGSAAGLKCLLQAGEKHLPWVQAVRKRHLEPVPRLREGRFLGNCKAVTALNDI
ncbi:thiamine-phosphate kinase, partial [Calderihabitans maritimus]|uniref:thiamine-phosphate kinase n=1 Tax=Calderihabitans maritimus TaxID=1246530 RepID=UPI000B510ED7